jgi:hypothetical protein
MSSGDESKSEKKEMMEKFNKYAKQVKPVLAKLEEIDKTISGAVKPADADDEKERMDKIFEKR